MNKMRKFCLIFLCVWVLFSCKRESATSISQEELNAPLVKTYDKHDTIESDRVDGVELDVGKIKSHQEDGDFFQRSLVDNNEYYFNGGLQGGQAHRYEIRIEQGKNFMVDFLAEPNSVEFVLRQNKSEILRQKVGVRRQEIASGIYELVVLNTAPKSADQKAEYSLAIF